MLSFFLQYDIAYADVGTLMSKINDVIINPIVTFMFAVALLFFVFGIVQFLANPADEEGRQKGKQNIIWGVVGMAIMVSVFGIMRFVINSLGFTGPGGKEIQLPEKQ